MIAPMAKTRYQLFTMNFQPASFPGQINAIADFKEEVSVV
jgi:hypothetical protein